MFEEGLLKSELFGGLQCHKFKQVSVLVGGSKAPFLDLPLMVVYFH